MSTNLTLAQDPQWAYAYAIQVDDRFEIYAVKPAEPATAKLVASVAASLPDNPTLIEIIPSPDGQFLALIYSWQNHRWQLNLFDLATGTSPEINHSLSTSPIDKIAWSPDSRRLAFTSSSKSESYEQLYVFDRQSGNIQSVLNEPTVLPIHFIWSPDSNQLAIYHVPITDLGCVGCIGTITLYNWQTQTTVAPVSLEVLKDLAAAQAPDAVCDVAWSPDGKYLSFISACNEGFAYHSEIYLIDINQNTLTPLTAYTGSMRASDPKRDGDFLGYYVTGWLDSGHLLAGIAVSYTFWPIVQPTPTPPPRIVQTLVFPIPAATPQILMNEAVMTEMAINPQGPRIAYTLTSQPTDVAQPVQIATFDGQNLSQIEVKESGCKLDWSPDGEVLAYSHLGDVFKGNCSTPVSYSFYDNVTGETVSYLLPVNAEMITIGWINTQF